MNSVIRIKNYNIEHQNDDTIIYLDGAYTHGITNWTATITIKRNLNLEEP